MNLQMRLLEWFEKNQRPLPWRKRCRPYEVWVSEIMLQQTQVETMLPYYRRWMKAFPDMKTLAESGERKVLKLWEGLGYYSRARNLHETAKVIMKKYDGTFPNRYDDILSLKGIGGYTAGAIASIAFNRDTPIVDGNVLRVLSRVYAIKKLIDVSKNKEIFWKLERQLIPKGQARFFNQALMELGALICTNQNPQCQACPINRYCKAFKAKNPEDYPVRKNRKKIIKVQAGAVIFSRDGKYLIQKRPLGEIMGGLWEFPEWKLSKGQRLTFEEIKRKTKERAETEFAAPIEKLEHLSTVKRNYTHHNETLEIFNARLAKKPVPESSRKNWHAAWVSKKEFEKYPFSSAHSKIANLIT